MKLINKILNIFKSKKAMCCKCFPLPYSLECFKDNFEGWKNSTPESEGTRLKDIWLVYPMLVFLNKTKETNMGTFYYYKCKHLINDLCSIHENKPDVCKRYGISDCLLEHLDCKSGCFKDLIDKEYHLKKLEVERSYKSCKDLCDSLDEEIKKNI